MCCLSMVHEMTGHRIYEDLSNLLPCPQFFVASPICGRLSACLLVCHVLFVDGTSDVLFVDGAPDVSYSGILSNLPSKNADKEVESCQDIR